MARLQQPLGSGFGSTTTAIEALGSTLLHGKVVIVTGGYSGIGLETTRVLAEAGATVIVPARSPEKARASLLDIPNVEQANLDLLDPHSITAFARDFLDTGRPLHLLINNAGIMACPLARDGRGYESQFSANHLGHFQLTAHLWPALVNARQARVICVSSRGHHYGGVDFDDPNFMRQDYNKWTAYGQSKTANILFALGMDMRGRADGVRAFSIHPGRIMTTDLTRFLSTEDLRAAGILDAHGVPDSSAQGKTVEQGAATTIWCATSEQLNGVGGVYCEDVDIALLATSDSHTKYGVMPWATDPALADRLWKLSEALTEVTIGNQSL